MKDFYDPLFVKKSSKKKFKELALEKNISMSSLFDKMLEEKTSLFTNPFRPIKSIDNPFRPIKGFKKNKKGNVILEVGLVLIILVAIILGVLYVQKVNDALEEVINTDDGISEQVKNVTIKDFQNYESRNDQSILIIFGFIWITVIFSSFLLDSNPIFFIISFILLIALMGAIMFIGNSMEEIINDDFIDQVPKYKNMYWISTHMLEILIIVAGSIMLSIFAKRRFFE